MERLTTKQSDALKKILFTDRLEGISRPTLTSLTRRGLLSSELRLTLKALQIIAPEAANKNASLEIQEARQVQNELIEVINKRGWKLNQRLSRDLPPEITGLSLKTIAFPEHISEFKRMIIHFTGGRG